MFSIGSQFSTSVTWLKKLLCAFGTRETSRPPREEVRRSGRHGFDTRVRRGLYSRGRILSLLRASPFSRSTVFPSTASSLTPRCSPIGLECLFKCGLQSF